MNTLREQIPLVSHLTRCCCGIQCYLGTSTKLPVSLGAQKVLHSTCHTCTSTLVATVGLSASVTATQTPHSVPTRFCPPLTVHQPFFFWATVATTSTQFGKYFRNSPSASCAIKRVTAQRVDPTPPQSKLALMSEHTAPSSPPQTCLQLECSAFEWTLWGLNVFVTVVFVLEMAVKIVAYGLKQYWREPLNCLDGLCALFSIAGAV